MIRRAFIAFALATGLLGFTAVAADAHTPSHGADCTSVWIAGTNYSTQHGLNSWSVAEDGVTVASGTFGSTLLQATTQQTPPGDAVSHVWVTHIQASDDPNNVRGFSPTYTNTVGPCGVQPPNDVQYRDVIDAPNCTTHTVTTEHQESHRSYSYDYSTGTWVPGDWTPWVTTSTTVTHTPKGTCAPAVRHGYLTVHVDQSCLPSERFVVVATRDGIAHVVRRHTNHRLHWVIRAVALPRTLIRAHRDGTGPWVHHIRWVIHLKHLGPCSPGPPGSGRN